MAHDIEIRFKCRALFEVMNKTLSDIAKQEGVGLSTLSEWKNDDREEYGGIWVQGCKTKNIETTAKKLRDELEATSLYDEMKNRVNEYNVIKDNKLEIQSLHIDNKELQANIETEVTLLATIVPDWFDNKLFRNAIYSSSLIERKMKKNPDSVKQSDLKTSSETIKIGKEARFGKSPDTVNFYANGEYTKEELEDFSVEEIEKLLIAEQQRLLNDSVVSEVKHDT